MCPDIHFAAKQRCLEFVYFHYFRSDQNHFKIFIGKLLYFVVFNLSHYVTLFNAYKTTNRQHILVWVVSGCATVCAIIPNVSDIFHCPCMASAVESENRENPSRVSCRGEGTLRDMRSTSTRTRSTPWAERRQGETITGQKKCKRRHIQTLKL